jgi:hypothetical protein
VNTLFSAAVDILDRQQLLAELRPLLDLKGDHDAEPRLLNLLSKHPIK